MSVVDTSGRILGIGSIPDGTYLTCSGLYIVGVPLNLTTTSGDIVAQIVTTHSNLTGLSSDDHTLYFLADGSREFSGDLLPEMTGASGVISDRSIGSPSQKIKFIYTHELFLDSSSLYVNNKKVIEDTSPEMVFKTDANQDFSIKTYGLGDINLISDKASVGVAAYGSFQVIAETADLWADVKVTGKVSATDGFQINDVASSAGQYLRSNGSYFVASGIQENDLPSSVIVSSTLLTASGNIVAQIPSLTGYATQSWTTNNFYTQAQISTISGNITSQIPSGATGSVAGIIKLTNHLGGNYTAPTVSGLQETGGQSLFYGAISDGQYLKRSGTTIIGDTLTAADVAAGSFPSGNFVFNGAIGANNPTIAAQAGHFYDNTTGSTNPVVLIHQDHASNTGVALKVQNDGSGDILALFNGASNHVRFPDPDTAIGTGYYGLYLTPSWGATGGDNVCMKFLADKTAADAVGVYGVLGQSRATHTSGTVTALVGMWGQSLITGSGGTTSYVTGLGSSITQTNGTVGYHYYYNIGTGVYNGTVSYVYGMNIPNLATATTTTKYGIYISAQTGASTNWDVYALGSSYFYDVYTHDGGVHSSDLDLKKDVDDCAYGLYFVSQLRPIQFRWKDDSYEETVINSETNTAEVITVNRTYKRKHFGFAAQEVGELLDYLGIDTEDFAPYINDERTGKGVRPTELLPILWQAVRELNEEKVGLQNELTTLSGVVAGLNNRVSALEI